MVWFKNTDSGNRLLGSLILALVLIRSKTLEEVLVLARASITRTVRHRFCAHTFSGSVVPLKPE